MLLCSYSVGVFSSRKIALACERNLAFLAIVGDDRPDFRTISDFRKLPLDAFADVFVEVLRLAAELGMVGLGNLAFDGSQFLGNAARHKAMRYGHMTNEKQRLKAEIEALLGQAQQTDNQEDAALGSRRGDELPAELRRREERLATISAARGRLEEQARIEAEAERQRRAEAQAERDRSGKKRRGERSPSQSAKCPTTRRRPTPPIRTGRGCPRATRAGIMRATPRSASIAGSRSSWPAS